MRRAPSPCVAHGRDAGLHHCAHKVGDTPSHVSLQLPPQSRVGQSVSASHLREEEKTMGAEQQGEGKGKGKGGGEDVHLAEVSKVMFSNKV